MDRPTADIHEPYEMTDILVKQGWNREHLTVGDFAIPTYNNDIAGIERKKGSDLLNSLASGRLAQQLQNLLNTYTYPFLLTEGSLGQSLSSSSNHSHDLIKGGGETKRNIEAVRNYLLTWQLKGIIHIRTSNPQDTVNRLCELVVYFSKPLHLGGLNKRVLGDERLMAFPSCIPIKQREALLKEHGTLARLAMATYFRENGEEKGEPKLITMIDGMGKTRTEALINFYHKENNK